MVTPKVPIAKEGYPFIGLAVFFSLFFAASDWECLSIIAVLATLFTTYFFRDPERFTPCGENNIISPADGKIIVIQKVDNSKFTDGEVYKVSIFMNVFNVHVNRIPISGTIKAIDHAPGKFYSADSEKGAEYNENCATTLTTKNNKKIIFVQVAGLIARRIVNWLEPEDTCKVGKRFGLIRFGSRVDLYLPTETDLKISIGDKVIAGETIIGKLTSEDATEITNQNIT